MKLFSRLADIINANIGSLLDKAEDPQKMLRLLIQEMETTLVDVRASTAKQLLEKKQLARRIEQLQKQQDEWEQKAVLAMSKAREDLARVALLEKQQLAKTVTLLENDLLQLDEQLTQLQSEIAQLESKLDESRQREDALLARQSSMQSRYVLRKQLDTDKLSQAQTRFAQFEAKLDHLEAKTQVINHGAGPSSLKQELESLSQNSEVETALAELRAKYSPSGNEKP